MCLIEMFELVFVYMEACLVPWQDVHLQYNNGIPKLDAMKQKLSTRILFWHFWCLESVTL